MRTRVVLSDELVAEIDALVGSRKRSQFIEQAVRERLQRERLLKALEQAAGVLSAEDYPEWTTSEAVERWVRTLREEGNGGSHNDSSRG